MPDLSDGVNWSEVDANNNQAPPNGWPEGMMPSGVNDAARADRGALKRFWNKANPVQLITPSGGVFTFTTANAAYPAAYVPGEIYSFKPNANSTGNDQFQVNALGPKPIWKRVQVATWGPIIAQDILIGVPPLLIYNNVLNAGTGVFVLVNPFVPITGDGSGTGASAQGSLTVAGTLAVNGGQIAVSGDLAITVPGHPDKTIGYLTRFNQAAGNRRLGITASDPGAIYYPLEQLWINAALTTMTGTLSATGYASRSGIAGPSQTNNFNIQWDGSQAHLWIDNVDEGPIVTGSAGNIVIGGNISAGSITTSGNITASGAVQGENLRSIGDSYVGNNLYVTGGTGNITASGAVQGENLRSIGDSYVGGNLYVTGLINGHPAMAWMTQYDELAARVAALEAALTARTE